MEIHDLADRLYTAGYNDRWATGNYDPRGCEEWKAVVQHQPAGEIVVTTNQDGHIVAVTRQDENGVILSVLAISEPIYKPEEKIAGYQVWWRLDGQVLDQLFENKERAESYVACIKSNAEVRTLYYKS